MRSISRDIVSAIIISKDNKIFLGRKDPSKGGVYKDCWHLPGGGIEKGETDEDALIREIQEETGIDITTYNKDLLSDTRRGQSTKILPNKEEVLCTMCFKEYKVSIHDKEALHIEVRVEDDLAEYQWVDINDIKNIQLTPPSKELFLELGYL